MTTDSPECTARIMDSGQFIQELQAENTRLREALERVYDKFLNKDILTEDEWVEIAAKAIYEDGEEFVTLVESKAYARLAYRAINAHRIAAGKQEGQ